MQSGYDVKLPDFKIQKIIFVITFMYSSITIGYIFFKIVTIDYLKYGRI